MKTNLPLAGILSLYTGFSYCDGPGIMRALGFMIGHEEPSLILAVDFTRDCAAALREQLPWLADISDGLSKNSGQYLRTYPHEETMGNDWQSWLLSMEQKYGHTVEVTSLCEHLNGIKTPHPVPVECRSDS